MSVTRKSALNLARDEPAELLESVGRWFDFVAKSKTSPLCGFESETSLIPEYASITVASRFCFNGSWKVNHKRVYRLYLELRIKARKNNRAALPRPVCPVATASDDRWSIDFVSEWIADGRAFRVLSLVDNVSSVSPALEADFKMTGERVCEVLN